MRKPEPTFLARAQAFNKPQVMKYLELLESTLKTHNISSSRVYDMDESGLSTVKSTQKIVALKGKNQVGAITSAERGVHCTVVCCVSSAETFIPPSIISGGRMN